MDHLLDALQWLRPERFREYHKEMVVETVRLKPSERGGTSTPSPSVIGDIFKSLRPVHYWAIIGGFLLLILLLWGAPGLLSALTSPVETPTVATINHIASSPTETPTHTVSPRPSQTPTLRSTQTPTRTPVSTQVTEHKPTATSTATPTITPTVTRTATPSCPSVTGVFAAVWEPVQGEIGCAENAAFTGSVVEENFERGTMFWREPLDYAQALVLFSNGTWQIFQHAPYEEGSPEYPCADSNTPAQTPPTPRRGFGIMWCDIPAIRNGLGNATDVERGYTGSMQQFDNGFMIRTDYGATYVFYSDGIWEQQ